MSRILKPSRIAVSVISALCLVWLIYRNANFLHAGFGIIEFRETDLIAMCLLCYAIMRAQWLFIPLMAAISISCVIAIFTIITKGIIMFFSEDNWIAGWHATNFAAGCCLFVLSLESIERVMKIKPNKPRHDNPY